MNIILLKKKLWTLFPAEKERVNEIARMLAGSEITKLTIEHAQELLAMAKK